jgi:hypothetical protein
VEESWIPKRPSPVKVKTVLRVFLSMIRDVMLVGTSKNIRMMIGVHGRGRARLFDPWPLIEAV